MIHTECRFGSVPVKDPEGMTSELPFPGSYMPNLTPELIFDAIKISGVRALVSAGWGGLGSVEPSSNVFILRGEPHVRP